MLDVIQSVGTRLIDDFWDQVVGTSDGSNRPARPPVTEVTPIPDPRNSSMIQDIIDATEAAKPRHNPGEDQWPRWPISS